MPHTIRDIVLVEKYSTNTKKEQCDGGKICSET